MASIRERISHAWNAFRDENDEDRSAPYANYGASFGTQSYKTRLRGSNERSIISSIYTQLSIDVSDVEIRHVRLDANDRFQENIKSGLNNCLTLEANIDQAGRAFRQDIALTLFDKGVAALVPVDTSINPITTGGFDIQTLRVGDIVAWYPRHVRVSIYDDRMDGGGRRREVTLPKSMVAIIENPLYSVMNEPNSTLQRLIHKLNMLDAIDEASSSGKLDLIIQLPYVIKSDARREQAEQRRNSIEAQLRDSKYGVAYTDGTEKVIQLNRPVENNLLSQIEFLTKMLYAQLGMSEAVFDGTADEATMLNYYKRSVKPVLDAITEALTRSFLTKTARSQGQSIKYFRDPFSLVPISQIADIADKFTRNEIATSNELRGAIGWTPSKDPKADILQNSNMPQPAAPPAPTESIGPEEEVQNDT